MSSRYSSAIVLGASISGLLTARALSNHFGHITVVERDLLTGGAEIRKGVSQSAHAHGLLASGYQIIDEYFPGLIGELEAQGASRCDVMGDFLWFQYGRWKLRHKSGLYGITVSRPCLEVTLRQQVKALHNVTILEKTEGIKPRFDAASGRVCGLVVRQYGSSLQTTIEADLVVDASGRNSQTPKWLEEFGFSRPEESLVKVNVGYATRIFERKPGDFFGSLGGIISGTPPKDSRMAAVLAAEGNRWVVTLVGSVGDYPPTDEEAWVTFAQSLPISAIHQLVTTNHPLTDIISYRIPATKRRYYERMKTFPLGYLVIGDAVCNFNPIYGQGMSVAAREAKALEECLSEGLKDLSQHFYKRVSRIVDSPWATATGEDFRFPQIEGKRPLSYWLLNRYIERVHAVASVDRIVCRKFFNVLNLLEPPSSLMSLPFGWRVLSYRVPRVEGSPWGMSRSEFS